MEFRIGTFSGKGFSLVELLVVIAIILILVALLLPMTLRLEDSVNVMIDINNYRNIYGAMYSYAEDNKGHIPHNQATRELGYYACWSAATYWYAKLGLSSAQRSKLVGCSGNHNGAGPVLNSYRQYVGNKTFHVFHCHSPKAPYESTSSDTNYSFRTNNHCGAHGGMQGPPGGWIIGTHNPKAHIVTEGILYRWGWQKNWDENKKRSPFEIIFGNGVFRAPWRHMGNKFPRLRLDGAAEATIFQEEWNSSRTIQGGWFPGSGGM